jgi:hypothetical protein
VIAFHDDAFVGDAIRDFVTDAWTEISFALAFTAMSLPASAADPGFWGSRSSIRLSDRVGTALHGVLSIAPSEPQHPSYLRGYWCPSSMAPWPMASGVFASPVDPPL